MTDTEQTLVEQHIRAYEARLKHIDELIASARADAGKAAGNASQHAQLSELAAERDRLAALVEKLRLDPQGDWRAQEIEKAGPMGIWDAVAQQLEQLVERLEGRGD